MKHPGGLSPRFKRALDLTVIPGWYYCYEDGHFTARLPFQSAERTDARLGIPRSQLVARALEVFIQSHQADQITERLNAIYGPSSNPEAVLQPDSAVPNVGLETLRKATEDDSW